MSDNNIFNDFCTKQRLPVPNYTVLYYSKSDKPPEGKSDKQPEGIEL